MSLLYQLSLGNPIGIDGYFLKHFELSYDQFQHAFVERHNDEKLAQWFLKQPGASRTSIDSWNVFGPNIGTPGYPASRLRYLIKWFVYPKSLKHPANSLFEMIEQDEAS